VPTHPIGELDEFLPGADYVANILPANAASERLFDAATFSKMREGALFMNIGRGTTVDQDALLAALPRLAAAYLDVTDPEPLPKEHPLWREPKVVITPHSAGGHRGEDVRLVRHFLANLARFEAGETLMDRVM
ncbi:D-2-hydroxyacid dehydrogenase, partial [bacterium]